MKRHSNRAVVWTLGLIVGSGLAAVLCSTDGWAKEAAKQAAKPATWDDYSIVVSENMFSKNRTPPREERITVRPPDPNAESFYILRGITSENGVFLVFLQDNKQGGVLQKHVGEEVARGKIKSVLSLDSIEFQMGDKTRTIQMGYDLEGGKGATNFRGPGGGDQRPGPGDVRGPDTRPGDTQGGRSRQQQRFGFDRQGSNVNRRDRGTGMSSMQPPASGATSSSSDTITGATPEEILQRLMEQRQRQLGQAPPPASNQNQQQPEQDQQQSGQGQQ